MRVGCQAAANQGRGWRQVGVAPEAEPWPREPPLQVEWAGGRGGEGMAGGPQIRPSQAGPGRAGLRRRGLRRGEVGALPRRLRGVGGPGAAEGPALASGGAGPAWRPEGRTGEAGS